MSRWIEIEVERTLTVDRGRDVILCDRSNAPNGETLLVLVSDEAIQCVMEQVKGRMGRWREDDDLRSGSKLATWPARI